ncbi:MAG: hypothetical protein R2852_05475 [Bacteroidia bacterium]
MRLVGIIALVLIFSSCAKKKVEEKVYDPTFLNSYFEEHILNKDIRVTEARFEGRDTTPMYNGYVFKLLKNTYYDGPFEAKYNNQTYTGTWQSNDDYSKLILNIKDNSALEWISITWKFKSKTTTSLELIPWFNTDGDKYVKFVK